MLSFHEFILLDACILVLSGKTHLFPTPPRQIMVRYGLPNERIFILNRIASQATTITINPYLADAIEHP